MTEEAKPLYLIRPFRVFRVGQTMTNHAGFIFRCKCGQFLFIIVAGRALFPEGFAEVELIPHGLDRRLIVWSMATNAVRILIRV